MTNGWWIIPATLIGATPAAAQQTCETSERLTMQLTHTHGELPQAMGLNGAGVMELWAGQSGTWTITITRPDGVDVCHRARGCVCQAGPEVR